jgi:hypothetical protein
MYNLGFRNFIEDLCLKAKTGYFRENSGELAEFQTIFQHGLQKFGMHKMDKNAVMDCLRDNGIRPKGENGRWAICGNQHGKDTAAGAARKAPSTTREDAKDATRT